MLGFLKKFLSRSGGVTVPTAAPPAPPSGPRSRNPLPVKVVARNGASPFAAPSPAPSRVPVLPASAASHAPPVPRPTQAGFVSISLGAIEPSLPEPLRHKIASALQEAVPVPASRLVAQLYRGTVTLTVEELRACAPELLASLSGHDDIPVSLPLAEIIPQLDAGCFTRRQDQRRVSIPEEVLSLFTQTSDGVTVLRPAIAAAPQPTISRAVPAAQPRPAQQPQAARPAPATTTKAAAPAVAATSPVAANAGKISLSADAMAALASSAPKKAATSSTPVPVSAGRTSISAPAAYAPLPNSTTTAPQGLAAGSATSVPAKPQVAAAAPIRSSTPLPGQTFAPATPQAPRPAAPATAPSPGAADEGPKLPVPLEKISGSLPEEIRRELGDVDIPGSTILVPMVLIQDSLKSGKVLFTWNDLSAWLQPPLPRPPSRSASELLVELPLKTIAPIFMAHHRGGSAQRKLEVDDQIPDLFQSGSGQAEGRAGVPTSASQPRAAISEPVAPQRNFEPASTSAAKNNANLPSLEEMIGPENKRFSPKQVIQNTTRLPGITGALLAMPDGLPVASIVPPAVKGDTIAAFLPQMFGRMSQYTKELGLGSLQSMALNVEGGCWHVFKQPNIYFAVYGKAGEAVPFNLLAQIAAELSKQSM